MGSEQERGLLSTRGSKLIDEAGHRSFHDVLEDIYQPEHNPDGIVSLGLAENSLMHNELLEFINNTPQFKMSSHFLMYGDGSHGSKKLRAAVASFVNEHFNPALPVESKHVRVSLGVSNANEVMAFVLANEGDGFLLGRPYYGAFVGDFWARAKVKTVGVAFGSTDPFSLEAVAKYEEALLRSNNEGVPIKALVLCTPNNPLGCRCYSREVIVELMKLCQKYQIHLVSDEIYALSVWDNPEARDAPPFTSVLSIDTAGIIDPSLVHAMWGMSKDFGANGLRIGYIIDQHNPSFRESVRQISLLNYPAAPSDLLATAILSTPPFTTPYIATNRTRIAAAYAFATDWLRARDIAFAPGSNAGFFLWIDVGRALSRATGNKPYDHELFKKLLAEAKLSVADALAFGGEEVGWFRVVFTHGRGFMEMALGRLEGVMGRYVGEVGR
ncbi:1-aminocyclopropane-1-carboxylate synthase-like protein 1 [Lasiodiplodia theobromae]|uniref:1-aminocyclopropane-1-carboxylate synthase-like protein 1 n=1 Tax=Lasiodiplodia theobromae TaxID=45133 RepID=A0A5N5DS75_9PEZI|nr:1-aminocyclopropane-1-carboxylate synthase-like protein 1 [Lasiodiplodia theobromae]